MCIYILYACPIWNRCSDIHNSFFVEDDVICVTFKDFDMFYLFILKVAAYLCLGFVPIKILNQPTNLPLLEAARSGDAPVWISPLSKSDIFALLSIFFSFYDFIAYFP